MDYSVREILHSINVIKASDKLSEAFRKVYGTDWKLVEASVKSNLIKKEAVKLITNFVPVCYKIGDNVYLKNVVREFNDNSYGETDGLIGAIELAELMNMTEEMKSGVSYSMYVSNVDIFEFATIEETLEVEAFLYSDKDKISE